MDRRSRGVWLITALGVGIVSSAVPAGAAGRAPAAPKLAQPQAERAAGALAVRRDFRHLVEAGSSTTAGHARTDSLPYEFPLKSLGAFNGLSDADMRTKSLCATSAVVCREPAQPNVAAGPNHLIQATNGLIRLTSRTGTAPATSTVKFFFDIAAGYAIVGSPRFVFDPVKKRWLGAVGTGSCDGGRLYLGISDTADPTRTWHIYHTLGTDPNNASSAAYPGLVPDDLHVGLSSDKILVGFNQYSITSCARGSHSRGQVTTVDWASLLTPPTGSFPMWNNYDSVWSSPKPGTGVQHAQTNPGPDGHMIVARRNDTEPGNDYGVYFRITGSVVQNTLQFVDGTFVAPFGTVSPVFSTPPPVKQPGTPATFTHVGSGPATAIFSPGVTRDGDALLFAATIRCPDGNGGFIACVQVTELGTKNPVTVKQTFRIPAQGDAYSPGLGVSRNRTLFIVYTTSGPTQNPSTAAVYQPRSASGHSVPPLALVTGAAPYKGTSWGSASGAAFDPSGAGAVWQMSVTTASDGTWKTQVSRLVVDGDKPQFSKPPTAAVRKGAVGADRAGLPTFPFTVTWTAADATSGVVSYEVETRRQPATTWVSVRNGGSTAYVDVGLINGAHRFRVRATDAYGNVSNWVEGPDVVVAGVQETALAYAPTSAWVPKTSSGAWGYVRSSSTLNATAEYAVPLGSRSVAVISPRANNLGKADVYLVYGGAATRFATVDLYANLAPTSPQAKQVVLTKSLDPTKSYRLRIVVLRQKGPASTGFAFDIDGVVTSK